jgi:divalent metal cation (Fe/Co/Zn/Cd) transporter
VADVSSSSYDLVLAHRWSLASVVWTVIASTTAIIAGIVAGSLLLIAFGAIGVLDAIGSTVLVVHFRHAHHHQTISERRERRALIAIAGGMAVIAIATSVESVERLFSHRIPDSSAVGTIVTATSVIVLAFLGATKGRIGRRVGSRALVADGHVSVMGAGMALFTVIGMTAAATLDWWWVDPSGSLLVAAVAVVVAGSHARVGVTG